MGTDMKVVDASIIVISNKCKAGMVELMRTGPRPISRILSYPSPSQPHTEQSKGMRNK
jgi:hypothetical protein